MCSHSSGAPHAEVTRTDRWLAAHLPHTSRDFLAGYKPSGAAGVGGRRVRLCGQGSISGASLRLREPGKELAT